MAELRRILINPNRISAVESSGRCLRLNTSESHYLRRVIRLKKEQSFAVVDGRGHLWEAILIGEDVLQLKTTVNAPIEDKSPSSPLICLGVVVPRRGFDEVLRMSCEIGIDLIQPLRSERSSPQSEEKPSRWESILREAVEQSERLWTPDLLPTMDVKSFWKSCKSKAGYAIATTRVQGLKDLHESLCEFDQDLDQIWVAIGPEGGWTLQEEISARDAGWITVNLGDNILRTSTASVVAIQIMANWRRSRVD